MNEEKQLNKRGIKQKCKTICWAGREIVFRYLESENYIWK